MLLTNYQHRYAALLAPHVALDVDTIIGLLTTPPQAELGDLAFPVFTLAKEKKIAPPVLASQMVEKISQAGLPAGFSKIVSAGPYVNIFIDMAVYAAEVLGGGVSVADAPSDGAGHVSRTTSKETGLSTQRILLEYMSGNPNKPLHVGHARNVCIGDTLRRVYTYAGYDIQTSHYGDDSGVNVGYNIVGHLYYNLPLETQKKFDHYCGEIYLQMRSRDEDEEFKQHLSKTLHAIENNSDPKIMALHQDYVKKCTIEQLRTCRRIGASFNMINWETDILHLDLFSEAIELLKTRGHVRFVDEEGHDAKGCWIIDLSSLPAFAKEEKQYGILVKSDGVATYVAKDIAFAMWKLGYLSKNFHFYRFAEQPVVDTLSSDDAHTHSIFSTTSDENRGAAGAGESAASHELTDAFSHYNQAITIIDNRQIPAQTVVRSALELLGLLGVNDAGESKEYTPLGYGVVYLTPSTLEKGGFELSDEEKAMNRLPFASRKGWTVTMDHMLDLLHERAYEETKARNEDKDDAWLHETAERIAVSSFRFFLTKSDIMKDITFDIDEVLDMQGETGAYALYTNARIKAVVNKTRAEAEGGLPAVDAALLTNPLEVALIKKIDGLSAAVSETIDGLAPHVLNRYIISMCQLFNSYYADVNIGRSDAPEKAARLALVEKVGAVLETAMELVGMKSVERM